MKKLRKIASFIRWRFVPMRYFTMIRFMRCHYLLKPYPVKTALSEEIEQSGYHVTVPIEEEVVKDIQALYLLRTKAVVPKNHGHPFVNLFTSEDIHPDNPVFRLAFSPRILEVAADYFNNKFILDSIQVLYSYSIGEEIRESQYWHLDYGDRKSFHAIIYLNDVSDSNDGPFVFVDKQTTKKIGRSLIVRRIADEQFIKELGDGEIRQFHGQAGSMVYVDPSACYHYGSRCKESRLAIFVTFSSWFPFVQPIPIVAENRQMIFSAAKQVRPDLSSNFLQTILQMS